MILFINSNLNIKLNEQLGLKTTGDIIYNTKYNYKYLIKNVNKKHVLKQVSLHENKWS